jgi:hypothetical protein
VSSSSCALGAIFEHMKERSDRDIENVVGEQRATSMRKMLNLLRLAESGEKFA